MAVQLRGALNKYLLNFNLLILVAFTFQNASSVLLSSYTQQRYAGDESPIGKNYKPMHLLMAVEVTKLLVSFIWLAWDTYQELKKKYVDQKGHAVTDGEVETVNLKTTPDLKESIGDEEIASAWRRGRRGHYVSVGSGTGGGGSGASASVCAHRDFLPQLVSSMISQVSLFRVHGESKSTAGSPTARGSGAVEPITVAIEEPSASPLSGGGTAHRCRGAWYSGVVYTLSHNALARFLLQHMNVEAFLMCVPAVAYAIQNMFILDSLSKLSPIVFQISFQFRILMVAVAMRALMGTIITRKRWFALCILFIGVVIGQFGAAEDEGKPAAAVPRPSTTTSLTAVTAVVAAAGGPSARMRRAGALSAYSHLSDNSFDRKRARKAGMLAAATAEQLTEGVTTVVSAATSSLVGGAESAAALAASARLVSGLTSLFIGCCISVLSAVYMEAIFKKRAGNAHLSTRNIHLAFFSIVYFSILSVREYWTIKAKRTSYLSYYTRTDQTAQLFFADAQNPQKLYSMDGQPLFASFSEYCLNYFRNFDGLVWSLVMVNACGGLLIALIMRYSDNIMKTMSTAAAIVVSGVGGYFIFNTHLSVTFLSGAVLVLSAVLMYNLA